MSPVRSAGGQRLYSADDVERLILLQRATATGHSIGEVARLDRESLQVLLDRSTSRTAAQAPGATDEIVRDAMLAVEALDGVTLEGRLRRGALGLGSDAFIEDALPRFLRTVGERWHRGSLTPAHEHLASQTVRRVLTWLSAAYEVRADAPRVVVATPANEFHELGAMLVAVAASAEGWRTEYLGPNLPAVDIVAAAVQVRARVVALSVVCGDGDAPLRELREIAVALPAGTTFVIGGMAAVRLERSLGDTRVRVVKDLSAFRDLLRERNGQSPSVAAD